MKLGGGVSVGEVLAAAAAAAAAAHSLTILNGSSPTVDIAGGYSSGSGHSPVTSLYDMAADNVFE